MPCFLGSEKWFQSTYRKPFLLAKDAQCSAKDAEARALAMEAPHKQVMSFLIQDHYCDLSHLHLNIYEQFYQLKSKK